MAHYKNSLVLILFIANIYLLSLSPANGDKALIDKICNTWTVKPAACQQCLSDETDKDQQTLATISVSCSFTQTMIVMHDFDTIAASTGDQKVKLLCDRCKQILAGAINNIHQATGLGGARRYADAAEQMRSASSLYEATSLLVKQIPSPPASFTSDYSLMDDYYLVSEGIFNTLARSS